MARIGFLGLGEMGTPMASRLLAARTTGSWAGSASRYADLRADTRTDHDWTCGPRPERSIQPLAAGARIAPPAVVGDRVD